MNKQKRFLLAQRACIEGYPPTLNQAALLSQIAQVVVLDAVTETDSATVLAPDCIKRVRIARKAVSSRWRRILERLNWLRRFHKEFKRQIATQPDAIIAYDPEAAYFLLKANLRQGKRLRIVHLHELPLPEYVASSPIGRFALQSMIKHLHRADIVIVPDRYRAAYLQKIWSLKNTPLVVMNCPRLLPIVPDSLLLPFLRNKGITSNKIVHYQGAVGLGHYFEEVIRSMRYWPPDAIFTIVGAVKESYLQQLTDLATAEGVEKRVIFIGRVPYDEVFAYAVGANVGVNFLNGKYEQFQLSAGASNKRFEYIALGIPQVTNDLTGVRELFVDTGVAMLADENDIVDIGAKISHYLENEILCEEASVKARKLHLESYNYERQMEPLLAMIGSD